MGQLHPCADDNELLGKPCWGGLDLSKTSDLTAFVLAFLQRREADAKTDDDVPPSIERITLKAWFWMPEEKARTLAKQDRVPYLAWAKQGLIQLTPGNVTDYRYVRKQLNQIKADYDVRDIAYDPWNATQFALELAEEDGFDMVEFRQTVQYFNEPCKLLEQAWRR